MKGGLLAVGVGSLAGQSPSAGARPSCLELVGEGLAKLRGSRTAHQLLCAGGAGGGGELQERRTLHSWHILSQWFPALCNTGMNQFFLTASSLSRISVVVVLSQLKITWSFIPSTKEGQREEAR